MAGPRLTDEVFAEVCERGFAILPAYLPQRQVAIARTRRLISAPASGKVRRYLANWCGRGMRSLRA